VKTSKELYEFDNPEEIARCMKKQWNVYAVVIDDDQDQAELLKEVLAPEGYCVLTADNAEEGLRLSQDCQPFVIITDFGMPDMDGAELVERLKVSGTPDIPVVLVTAYPPDHVQARGLRHASRDRARLLSKRLPTGALLTRPAARLFRERFAYSSIERRQMSL